MADWDEWALYDWIDGFAYIKYGVLDDVGRRGELPKSGLSYYLPDCDRITGPVVSAREIAHSIPYRDIFEPGDQLYRPSKDTPPDHLADAVSEFRTERGRYVHGRMTFSISPREDPDVSDRDCWPEAMEWMGIDADNPSREIREAAENARENQPDIRCRERQIIRDCWDRNPVVAGQVDGVQLTDQHGLEIVEIVVCDGDIHPAKYVQVESYRRAVSYTLAKPAGAVVLQVNSDGDIQFNRDYPRDLAWDVWCRQYDKITGDGRVRAEMSVVD